MHRNGLGGPFYGAENAQKWSGEAIKRSRKCAEMVWEEEETEHDQEATPRSTRLGFRVLSIIQYCWRTPGDRPVPNREQVATCGATYVLLVPFRGRCHYRSGAASRKSDEERLGRRRQQRRRRLGRV